MPAAIGGDPQSGLRCARGTARTDRAAERARSRPRTAATSTSGRSKISIAVGRMQSRSRRAASARSRSRSRLPAAPSRRGTLCCRTRRRASRRGRDRRGRHPSISTCRSTSQPSARSHQPHEGLRPGLRAAVDERAQDVEAVAAAARTCSASCSSPISPRCSALSRVAIARARALAQRPAWASASTIRTHAGRRQSIERRQCSTTRVRRSSGSPCARDSASASGRRPRVMWTCRRGIVEHEDPELGEQRDAVEPPPHAHRFDEPRRCVAREVSVSSRRVSCPTRERSSDRRRVTSRELERLVG